MVNDQKTTRSTGTSGVDIPSPLREVYRLWLEVYRPFILGSQVGWISATFFVPGTSMPFTQSSFSKFCQKSFKAVTGKKLGLQTIRHVFASGISKLPPPFFASSPFPRLPGKEF